MTRSLADAVPAALRRRLYQALPRSIAEPVSLALHGQAAWQRRTAGAVRRALSARAGADAVLVRDGRVFRRARRITAFRAEDVLDAAAARVATELARAGIAHAARPASCGQRRVVLVPAAHRAAALAALDAPGAPGAGWYAAAGAGEAPRPVTALGRGRAAARLARAPVVRVFQLQATPGGLVLADRRLGCDVEFSDGPAHEAAVVPATLAGEPRADDVRFPVDLVYTWVDDTDPGWQDRRARAWSAASGSRGRLAGNASRFRNRDELRYSLRSVDMYASWVRRIFVVTDAQVPSWLARDSRVTVVDHREILPASVLPTFNSHAIETALHRIDGLAEHYLYLNDDVFLGRPVHPGLFFTADGRTRFFLSKALIPPGSVRESDAPVDAAAKNNRDLLRRDFGRTVVYKFKHVPHPQRRSVLAEMQDRYGAELDRTAAAAFRSPADYSVASSLSHYYAWMTGRGVPGGLRYFFTDVSAREAPSRLRRLSRGRSHDVFCLNDHDSDARDPGELDDLVGGFLADYFPLPSAFESSVAATRSGTSAP